VSPSTIYRSMRLERAKWLLVHSNLSITKIAIDCGFADTSHLTRTFKQQCGELPTNFRRRTTPREPETAT
jgi:transcriptional regulator GlxA family with amidase domain